MQELPSFSPRITSRTSIQNHLDSCCGLELTGRLGCILRSTGGSQTPQRLSLPKEHQIFALFFGSLPSGNIRFSSRSGPSAAYSSFVSPQGSGETFPFPRACRSVCTGGRNWNDEPVFWTLASYRQFHYLAELASSDPLR
jgi:hypothetical protein